MRPARGGTIEILPPDVANQIAAGEVVERPASVVKELVENALDAGARTVSVSIDEGGVARILVSDDGAGLTEEDLTLSVVRHATSKIRKADDLVGVATYGFRGEALPSIASVSKLRIVSRTRESDEGAEIVVEGGSDGRVRPAGCPPGTTVTVESLFFNTPARRKFLRTPGTESAACVDAVVRLALPRPDVKISVRRDGKVSREFLRQETIFARAKEIYADDALAEMRGERGGLRVLAMLGPPERARSGTQSLALFVNGRSVRDRLLLRAVAQAYGSTLEGGRYPVGALLLEVPATDVDVNVHPQKAEVRFAAQNEVFAAISSVVREHLGGAPWARATASGTAHEIGLGRFEGGPMHQRPSSQSLFGAAIEPARPLGAFVSRAEEPDPWGLAPRPPYPPASYPVAQPNGLDDAFGAGREEGLLGDGAFGSLRYVAQLRRMFLVCEGTQGMVVLDQHAAAERVTYQRLRRAYAAREVAMQPLLVPETIQVTPAELALVEDHAADLARLGFELSPRGPTTLAVRAVPALMVRADPRRLARDVLDEVARSGNEFSRALELALATMACHGSVRAGDELADEEARALLRALDDVEFAGHCPHGRPVVWSMRWTELERRVGR